MDKVPLSSRSVSELLDLGEKLVRQTYREVGSAWRIIEVASLRMEQRR